MLKSIYTPLSGAIAQERVLEVVANNLANANTTAFKGDKVTFSLLPPEPYKNYASPLPPANYKRDMSELFPLKGNEIDYAVLSTVERDTTRGPAKQTGNPLDLMLESDGYFAVMTPDGVRYTRDGALTLSSEGQLVTQSGHPVMGAKGDIFVRAEGLDINRQGEIYLDGELVDRVLVYRFADEAALERVGGNQFFFGGPFEDRALVAQPEIASGFLEGSNVNPIQNLTAMILAHRSYEAYQKAVSSYDAMMDRTSNSIGELRG